MHLPKGSVVVANIWYAHIARLPQENVQLSRNMLHDPEVFANPMEFDPGRYLNLDSEMEKVTEVVFGFGRRVCPGKLFAEGTLFAIVATVLATCNVLPLVDADGKNITQDITFSPGAFRQVGFTSALYFFPLIILIAPRPHSSASSSTAQTVHAKCSPRLPRAMKYTSVESESSTTAF
jgi:hypothetical protein